MVGNLDLKEEIVYAISRYDYAHAYKLAKRLDNVEARLVEVLYIMAERRELNIHPAMECQLKIRNDFQLFCHESEEDEQLANYLYDLEAKLKNEQVIDFIRAVSPAIYRIFMRLVKLEIPDIESYIHNSREASYDEEELYSTTGFSSQFFMEILILLAQATGITYDKEQFYFDRVNQVIKTLLD